jgi:hypothetical protein
MVLQNEKNAPLIPTTASIGSIRILIRGQHAPQSHPPSQQSVHIFTLTNWNAIHYMWAPLLSPSSPAVECLHLPFKDKTWKLSFLSNSKRIVEGDAYRMFSKMQLLEKGLVKQLIMGGFCYLFDPRGVYTFPRNPAVPHACLTDAEGRNIRFEKIIN